VHLIKMRCDKLRWLSAAFVFLIPGQLAVGQDSASLAIATGRHEARGLAFDCDDELASCHDTLKQLESQCQNTTPSFLSIIFDFLIKIFLSLFSSNNEDRRRKLGLFETVLDSIRATSISSTSSGSCLAGLEECTISLDNFACGAPVEPPVSQPIPAPVAQPIPAPTAQVATFYAIADVPYNDSEAEELKRQMKAMKDDADFLIHLGDIRLNNGKACNSEEYSSVASILALSPIPVFLVPGDNEISDCGQGRSSGLQMWKGEFLGFESRYWNPPFDIERQSGYEENFSFVYEGTLFIGLHIVGGSFESYWTDQLTDQLQWTKTLIRNFVDNLSPLKGRIVLFAHAQPNSDHRRLFFDPLATFIEQTLNNQTPFLYIHGDGHYWLHNPSYRGQESWLQMMMRGGTSEPPVKVSVRASGKSASTADAFKYDRQL